MQQGRDGVDNRRSSLTGAVPVHPISFSSIHSIAATATRASVHEARARVPFAAPDAFQVMRGTGLTAQLAEVDCQIKELLQAIDVKRNEETQIKDQLQQNQEREQSMLGALNKAADSYHQLLDATSLIA
jgi:hypothetical protein